PILGRVVLVIPPGGRSHGIAPPPRRGRQCGGGSTWITRKGLRSEGWPRPFVIDATAASFLLILHYRGASKKGVPGYVRLQSAQCANTPSQSGRKTRHA